MTKLDVSRFAEAFNLRTTDGEDARLHSANPVAYYRAMAKTVAMEMVHPKLLDAKPDPEMVEDFKAFVMPNFDKVIAR